MAEELLEDKNAWGDLALIWKFFTGDNLLFFYNLGDHWGEYCLFAEESGRTREGKGGLAP